MSDKYLGFNYKNVSYSTTAYSLYNDFKGFIINEGADLTFFNPSNFSHEFMTPQFGNQRYFMGTTQESREFVFPILLNGVTLIEYKNFLQWLNPKDEGILWFEYNDKWGYNVKVNSISEAKFTVNNNCSTPSLTTYNIELTVGFITKNDWAATLLADIASITISAIIGTNPYYLHTTGLWDTIPGGAGNDLLSITYDGDEFYTFINYCHTQIFINLIYTNVSGIVVYGASDEDLYLLYSGSTTSFTFYSEYALGVTNAGSFIPFSVNTGIISIEPGIPTVFRFSPLSTQILPVVREIL